MKNILTHLVDKKVDITIYTKPLDEQGDISNTNESIKILNNYGIKNIFFRERMHEKIVLIDKDIVYVGSLNPLSQFSSKELMIRTEDPDFQAGMEIFVDKLRYEEYDSKVDITPKKYTLEEAERALKSLRSAICFEKRYPLSAVLHNDTIKELLKGKPKTVEDMYKIKEFTKKNSPIAGFEEKVLSIISNIS
jgi:phosphatidylserine/phosphatidylglycerophosphate/cardiolipin synthase-like enzyme